MQKVNSLIQQGKLTIRNNIAKFQQENQIPNFVIEMILQEILVEIKERRLSEMLLENTSKNENSVEKDGDKSKIK